MRTDSENIVLAQSVLRGSAGMALWTPPAGMPAKNLASAPERAGRLPIRLEPRAGEIGIAEQFRRDSAWR
jgi:hypothetical protein